MNRQNHSVSVGAADKVLWHLSLRIALEVAPPWAIAMNILAWTERALRADENFCFMLSRPGRWGRRQSCLAFITPNSLGSSTALGASHAHIGMDRARFTG
jgi:hypothetical protein